MFSFRLSMDTCLFSGLLIYIPHAYNIFLPPEYKYLPVHFPAGLYTQLIFCFTCTQIYPKLNLSVTNIYLSSHLLFYISTDLPFINLPVDLILLLRLSIHIISQLIYGLPWVPQTYPKINIPVHFDAFIPDNTKT